jgi:hypothetical protein
MCFSPLRRKTSELEGEEYTSMIVSGIDRLDPPLVMLRKSQQSFHTFVHAFGQNGKSDEKVDDLIVNEFRGKKSVKKLFIFFTDFKNGVKK